jgi:hypothetical protein
MTTMTTAPLTTKRKTNYDWEDDALCANHPILPKNAWLNVEDGYPQGDGCEALLVCRTQCPVMDECKRWYRGKDVIAGGGWFGSNGGFRGEDRDLLDIHQVAAYVGVPTNTVRYWAGTTRLRAVAQRGGRSWFTLENAQRLALIYGPEHGTAEAKRLHLIRGEDMCGPCRVTRTRDVSPMA